MSLSSANQLNLEKIVKRTFKKDSRFASFIQDKSFWPIATKGGCENTLRDIILDDINFVLGSNWICTGERHRIDIAIYRRDVLKDDNCVQDVFRSPSAAIELKFNFARQPQRELLRGVEVFNRLREGGARNFAVIHMYCEIECADNVSANLLMRYVCCRNQEIKNMSKHNRTRAFDVIETLLREKAGSAKITKLGPNSISDGTSANRGKIQAFLLTPK